MKDNNEKQWYFVKVKSLNALDKIKGLQKGASEFRNGDDRSPPMYIKYLDKKFIVEDYAKGIYEIVNLNEADRQKQGLIYSWAIEDIVEINKDTHPEYFV